MLNEYRIKFSELLDQLLQKENEARHFIIVIVYNITKVMEITGNLSKTREQREGEERTLIGGEDTRFADHPCKYR